MATMIDDNIRYRYNIFKDEICTKKLGLKKIAIMANKIKKCQILSSTMKKHLAICLGNITNNKKNGLTLLETQKQYFLKKKRIGNKKENKIQLRKKLRMNKDMSYTNQNILNFTRYITEEELNRIMGKTVPENENITSDSSDESEFKIIKYKNKNRKVRSITEKLQKKGKI